MYTFRNPVKLGMIIRLVTRLAIAFSSTMAILITEHQSIRNLLRLEQCLYNN
jgi:hypothetical protein